MKEPGSASRKRRGAKRMWAVDAPSRDVDKTEVYKDPDVVDTYDERLYFGRSGGLFYQREVSHVEDWFPETARILDAPCGTGKLGHVLTGKPKLTLYGMDISELMVQAAAKTGTYSHLLIGDMRSTPFPDECFDIVYVSRFFMLFEDIRPFLKETARVLRPGGLLIFDNIRRSIHNLVHATVGTAEGWNYLRKTCVILRLLHEMGYTVMERRSAFLLSTGIMNRLPPWVFRLLWAMERKVPESWRVMEFYKAVKSAQSVRPPGISGAR